MDKYVNRHREIDRQVSRQTGKQTDKRIGATLTKGISVSGPLVGALLKTLLAPGKAMYSGPYPTLAIIKLK